LNVVVITSAHASGNLFMYKIVFNFIH